MRGGCGEDETIKVQSHDDRGHGNGHGGDVEDGVEER